MTKANAIWQAIVAAESAIQECTNNLDRMRQIRFLNSVLIPDYEIELINQGVMVINTIVSTYIRPTIELDAA